MRRSIQFLLFTAVILTVFLLLPLHARNAQQHRAAPTRQLQNLHVTDLCLATEARYTRHPAVADRHTPFQEHPLALEHFPTGALILPNLPGRDTK
ncbi:MAG TPA: hypothetical protein HPP97_04160 [Desulfuromonadales bacterium]|nr:hypothetical protein [Desulfuromonadales bacterium]